VGGSSAPDAVDCGCRRALGALDRDRTRVGPRRARRPRHPRRRHRRQPLRLDERHQGRRRLAGPPVGGANCTPMLRPTRLLALGGLAVLALLYWKPLHNYLQTKQELHERQSEVRTLAAERRRLAQQIAAVGSGTTLVREARNLGLVKPGERLFIVRGI